MSASIHDLFFQFLDYLVSHVKKELEMFVRPLWRSGALRVVPGYGRALAYDSCRVSNLSTTQRDFYHRTARVTISNPFDKVSMLPSVLYDANRLPYNELLLNGRNMYVNNRCTTKKH